LTLASHQVDLGGPGCVGAGLRRAAATAAALAGAV